MRWRKPKPDKNTHLDLSDKPMVHLEDTHVTKIEVKTPPARKIPVRFSEYSVPVGVRVRPSVLPQLKSPLFEKYRKRD